MSDPASYLKKKLRKDATFKSFRNSVDMAWNPEFDNFIPEITRLHKVREIRILKRGNKASRLSEAALNDQSTRSRLVEIAIQVTANRNLLERSLTATYKYIEATYNRGLLKAGAKTLAAQKACIETVLAPARSKMEQMDTLIEIADRVIEDVDKGSFALKHALDALQISTKREYAS